MVRGDQPVRRVTIVGGGTAGWMTAAVLSQWLSQVEITLVESDEIGDHRSRRSDHSRTSATILTLAGIDPLRMISETKATFKLGIQFVDWGAPGETYIHGFGKIGRDMLWLHPHQLWMAARERAPDSVKHFDHYSLNCAASLQQPIRLSGQAQSEFAARGYRLCLSFRCVVVRALPSRRKRSARREARRGTHRRSRAGSRERLRQSREAGGRPRGRRRPVRRLLGHAGAADRRRAGRRLRGLEPVAAVRPGHGGSVRKRLAADALHAFHGAHAPAGNGASRSSTASATATSTASDLISDEEVAETLLANLDGDAAGGSAAGALSARAGGSRRGRRTSSRSGCRRASSSRWNRPAST